MGVQGGEGREGCGKARSHQLVEVLGLQEILQAMRPEVEEGRTIREAVGAEEPDGFGGDDLAPMGDAGDPGRAVDGQAHEAAAGERGGPGVDAHPHPDRAAIRPRLRCQRALDVKGRVERLDRGRKDDEE